MGQDPEEKLALENKRTSNQEVAEVMGHDS